MHHQDWKPSKLALLIGYMPSFWKYHCSRQRQCFIHV